jgi:hypothetical protein
MQLSYRLVAGRARKGRSAAVRAEEPEADLLRLQKELLSQVMLPRTYFCLLKALQCACAGELLCNALSGRMVLTATSRASALVGTPIPTSTYS